MSIIVEALQKAEKPRANSGNRNRRRRFSSFLKYLSVVIALATFLAIPLIYFLSKDFTLQIPSEEKEPAILAGKDKEEIEEIREAAPILISLPPDRINERIELSGIMYTQDMPLAVINDAIWCEGDTVGEFKILEIGKDYLRLDSSGEQVTLRLKQ